MQALASLQERFGENHNAVAVGHSFVKSPATGHNSSTESPENQCQFKSPYAVTSYSPVATRPVYTDGIGARPGSEWHVPNRQTFQLASAESNHQKQAITNQGAPRMRSPHFIDTSPPFGVIRSRQPNLHNVTVRSCGPTTFTVVQGAHPAVYGSQYHHPQRYPSQVTAPAQGKSTKPFNTFS